MSDPSPGAAETALNSAGCHDPAAAPLPERSGGGGSALAPGRRWRNFQVQKALGTGFMATDITSMDSVFLHARPLDDATPSRADAWERLARLPSDTLVAALEAHEENGWRYEVSALPRGMPLRDWMAAHQLGVAEIETLVRQLAAQLEALHENGIVHLRVQPQSVYVDDEGHGLHVCLGGLEAATLHSQTDLIPIAVNPYYAPPEAAGLFKHKPGPELGAWDWWGLGRVAQEIAHGGHVYGLLFERDVAGEPPELRSRAEAALLDRDPSGVRAGAVELLPDSASPRLRSLLRGLLASSRDGRWHGDQVLHWTQRENVPDRYDLPRDARLFWWRRRALTVAEAAEFFLQPDYAFDGQQQFFPTGAGEPTMRAFLAELPNLRPEHERAEQILGYVESFAWQQLPLNVRRAAVAGLAWRALAPAGGNGSLAVQRWRIDPAGLQEMFADAPPGEALAFARALSTGAYRRAVEALDAGAGRTLALLAEAGLDALQAATACRWIADDDEVAQARLLWFAFEPEKDLIARRDRLRTAYATAHDAALAEMLAKAKPKRAELMLLAFASERPSDFGFVTHADWNARRAAELTARAERLRTAIFWQRAARVLAAAPGLLGRWPAFVAVWAAPLALAAAGRAWLWLGVLTFVAIGLRWTARATLNSLIARQAPGEAPWTWRDGPARAVRAASASREALAPEQRANPLADLAAACADLRALASKGAPVPAPPSRFIGFWAGAVLADVLPLAFCVLPWLGVDFSSRPPPPVLVRHAPPPPAETAPAAAGAALFEVYDDGFGRRKRGPLRAWDVALEPPRPLSVTGVRPASANQRAYARVGAELLLEPYPRKDLKVTLAVPVPTPDGWALVLYDPAERELADRRTFLLREAPQEKHWYWLGNRRVVYLGAPPHLPPLQNSLAQP
ncbi:MAG: hypothetical protein HYV96_13575 [Opitutae bacterium]|nr:hypothetical protein [Opitutae bacterium]